MSRIENLSASVEAVMFASGDGIDAQKLAPVFGVTPQELEDCLDGIMAKYRAADFGIEVIRMDHTYQFVTKTEFADVIREARSIKKNAPLSSAAFEVLAIVAYNQPVTKSFIEQVRGVDCSAVMSGLCQKNLIEECGRLDLPGRPLLYCTTEHFLRCFRMSSLDELPELPQQQAIEPAQEQQPPEEVSGQLQFS